MIKPTVYRSGFRRPLKNTNSRLTPCICCCPNLPDTLCLHWEPDFNLSECVGRDQGFSDVTVSGESIMARLQGGVFSSCEVWSETTIQNQMTCTADHGGEPVPPVEYGLTAELYCFATNTFKLRVCLHTPGSPSNPENCNETHLLDPIGTPVTCNYSPSLENFFIDFGSIQPFLTVPEINTLCDCTFSVWVDQCEQSYEQQKPIYYYSAESAQGVPPLQSSIWFWENHPNISTPQHPTRRRIEIKQEDVGPPPKDVEDILGDL